MKKSVLIATVLMLASFSFASCESENLDNEKPVVKIISPVEDEMVKPGSYIHFEVELSDNVALSSYKVNIHGAFNGHTHNHGAANDTVLRSAESDSVEFNRTWLENDFIALGNEAIAGKRNVSIHHHHMDIPATIAKTVNGEQKEMPLREGHYHFIVFCTDVFGQESFVSTEIIISYDADDVSNNH